MDQRGLGARAGLPNCRALILHEATAMSGNADQREEPTKRDDGGVDDLRPETRLRLDTDQEPSEAPVLPPGEETVERRISELLPPQRPPAGASLTRCAPGICKP